jgi:hypothetical protein
MLRLELPPDYDLGFLCLHKEAFVTATFRMTNIVTVRSPFEFTLNLRCRSLSLKWSEPPPVNVLDLSDSDMDAWLPDFQGKDRVVFSSRLESAMASNTTTGFRLNRYSGRTLLEAWRSRRHKFFVYVDGIWIATDGQDACALMRASQHNADMTAYLSNLGHRCTFQDFITCHTCSSSKPCADSRLWPTPRVGSTLPWCANNGHHRTPLLAPAKYYKVPLLSFTYS